MIIQLRGFPRLPKECDLPAISGRAALGDLVLRLPKFGQPGMSPPRWRVLTSPLPPTHLCPKAIGGLVRYPLVVPSRDLVQPSGMLCSVSKFLYQLEGWQRSPWLLFMVLVGMVVFETTIFAPPARRSTKLSHIPLVSRDGLEPSQAREIGPLAPSIRPGAVYLWALRFAQYPRGGFSMPYFFFLNWTPETDSNRHKRPSS